MTGLTVPVAGTNPGRAARAQQVPAGRAGNAIAQLGQIMTQVGAGLEQDRQENALESARLATARDMNRLRAEVSEMGDPYEAEASWSEGAAAIQKNALTQLQGYHFTPEQTKGFVLEIEGMRDQSAMTLGPLFIAAKVEHRHRQTAALGDELAQAWIDAPAPARAAIEQQFFDQVDRQTQSGLLTPEQAEMRKDQWADMLADQDAARDEDDEEPNPFFHGEPHAADMISDRLEADPDLARLAAARQYLPMTPTDVEDMAAMIERADALPEDKRRGFIDAEIEAARNARRASLARPAFQRGPKLDAAEFAAAAQRLHAAWQAGRISAAQFQREADLLRAHQELMNE